MKRVAVLCDFDGTVAQDDVGNRLFHTFASDPTTPIVDRWKAGEISSRACLEQEAALACCSKQELNGFIAQCKLDPYFKDFVDFAHRREYEVAILSDGLDYYIEQMLMSSGLGHIDFFANSMTFRNGGMEVSFPHYDMKDCRECGNCKTHHLEKYRSLGYYIVYVGDGLSDRCPCSFSNLVFAKGDLLHYCLSNDIDHVPFNNFRDVERELLERFVLGVEEGEGVG